MAAALTAAERITGRVGRVTNSGTGSDGGGLCASHSAQRKL